MTDFLLSSNRGFIGPRLAKELASRGYKVAFAQGSDKSAAVFVNLSNDHDCPQSNLRLFKRRLAEAKNCRTFVQFQSFGTLSGPRIGEKNRFNCGYFPLFLDNYAAGKLLVEEYLQRYVGNERSCVLLYCSAVIDEGGNWEKLMSLSLRRGFYRPYSTAPADFNHITIPEIADSLASVLDDEKPSFLRRIICNSSKSKGSSYEKLLRGLSANTPVIAVREPAFIKIKEGIRFVRLFIFGLFFRAMKHSVLAHEGNVKKHALGVENRGAAVRSTSPPPPEKDVGPIVIQGLARLAIAQGYIDPS